MRNLSNPTYQILILILFILIGCTSDSIELPTTEIVYQANMPDSPKIGFVNRDGSNLILIEASDYIVQPTWGDTNQEVYYRDAFTNSALVSQYPGTFFYWPDKKTASFCPKEKMAPTWAIQSMPGSNQVLFVDNYASIIQVDPEDCTIVNTLVDYSSDPFGRHLILDASLSLDGRFVIYTDRLLDSTTGEELLSIKKHELASGTTLDLGQGIHATLSPDNQWVAFTWNDGIYLMDADGLRRQKIVSHGAIRNSSLDFEESPPAPQWSPDGTYLIYHMCEIEDEQGGCSIPSDYGVYLFDISLGEETLLVEGGLYPHWR